LREVPDSVGKNDGWEKKRIEGHEQRRARVLGQLKPIALKVGEIRGHRTGEVGEGRGGAEVKT